MLAIVTVTEFDAFSIDFTLLSWAVLGPGTVYCNGVMVTSFSVTTRDASLHA